MSYTSLARVRRLSQIFFFLLFLFLLFRTEFRGSVPWAQPQVRLPYPVSIFLQADPLVGIANALSTRALYRGLLWGLVILIPSLFLGRVFCGWACPLGTLNHFFSSWKSEKKRGWQLLESNRYKRWQTLKYYLLIVLLISALLGGALVVLMDPISLLVRSLALSALPAINYGADGVFGWLHQSGANSLRAVAEVSRLLVQGVLVSFKQPYFRQGFFLGLIFLLLLVLNLRVTRFWCRALCPLGALLGIASRWSVLQLEKESTHCEDCNRCLLHCQGGDDPVPDAPWRKAECHFCFNCAVDCPEGSLHFKFLSSPQGSMEGPNLSRRRALTSLAAGAALLPLLRSTPGLAVAQSERLVRPPGALAEKNFLERCIRCGECMKVCPNNALQPSFVEAGLEGLWTPVLVPRIGYCEPSCVLCGQVCPTGAIWEITTNEKGWAANSTGTAAKPIRVGTAFYDRGRCLPWAMATECIVCEEWCPTSPKAVYLRPAEVADAAGKLKLVRQPYVDPERCVGCGACEFACPVKDRPAVYVTSIGESRSKTNQVLLKRAGEKPA